MLPLKIVIIGPVGVGKTTISNFLADSMELSYDYRPTQGTRILEFDVSLMDNKNKPFSVDIELWDCSGDLKFFDCWPIFKKNMQGVIFVYNKKSNEQIKQLEKLYNYFIVQNRMDPRHCLILYFNNLNLNESQKRLTNIFEKVSQVDCNVEEGGNKLKTDFNTYLNTLILKMKENI